MISVRTIFIALTYLTIASAFNLKCIFRIKFDMYCCSAQNLDIDEPHTKISSVSGTHLPNLTNADVHYLDIIRQRVKFLPINFAEYFPNLKKITVKHSRLKFITPNDFLGLTQLTHLVMANNNIRELSCGVFDTNKKLQEIHFENNVMTNIVADIFEPLSHLKVAHFRHNNCINMDADNSTAVLELLNEIKKKCVVSCDKSKSYTTLESSCDSKFHKKVLNEMESTINTLELKYNASRIHNKKLINENEELSVKLKQLETKNVENINEIVVKIEKESLENKLKDLEAKHNKTVDAAKQNEEQLYSKLLKMETTINEYKAGIKSLENIILNLSMN